jgi:hypothetical protein
LLVFKTSAFNRSAMPPKINVIYQLYMKIKDNY